MPYPRPDPLGAFAEDSTRCTAVQASAQTGTFCWITPPRQAMKPRISGPRDQGRSGDPAECPPRTQPPRPAPPQGVRGPPPPQPMPPRRSPRRPVPPRAAPRRTGLRPNRYILLDHPAPPGYEAAYFRADGIRAARVIQQNVRRRRPATSQPAPPPAALPRAPRRPATAQPSPPRPRLGPRPRRRGLDPNRYILLDHLRPARLWPLG